MPLIETRGTASSRAFGQFAQQAVAANYIEDLFSTYLYTGNGGSQTISNGLALSTKGGMVWIKQRSDVAVSGGNLSTHTIFDTNRGAGNAISSAKTDVENTSAATLYAFTASGFSVTQFTSNGSPSGLPYEANYNGVDYASWSFRKQAKFFDVVTYTGNNTAGRTISHSLGAVPGCIMVKRLTTADNWIVWHRVANGTGNGYGFLNTTGSFSGAGQLIWGNGVTYTAPTSSVFTVSNDPSINATGDTYVAYIFAHNAGGFGSSGTENAISCGNFTTDGSGNATVTLGWEPQWILRKSYSGFGTTGWEIGDNMRGLFPPGTSGPFLRADSDLAESNLGSRTFGITSTGFVATGSPSTSYIYIAIRRGPMRTPTSGTSVFTATTTVNAAFPYFTSGFPVDLGFRRQSLSSAGQPCLVASRLTGDRFLQTSSTDAEFSGAGIAKFDSNTGWYNFTSASPAISWMLRRAPGFFDVVCYTGTGSNRTVNHSLGVVPEMVLLKDRTTAGTYFCVYHSSMAAGSVMYLSLDFAETANSTIFTTTAPTSSVFSVGTNSNANASGDSYVAYLFSTVAGVSKVGTYTGTGTTQQINCGFTGGARFVMIKRKDSTGDWYVWDTARGIVAGNDPYLLLNSTASQVTGTDYIDTLSSGFEISSTAPAAINANGGSYIFLAIA